MCVGGETLQGNFKLHHQPLKNNQRRVVQPELPTGPGRGSGPDGFEFIPGVPGSWHGPPRTLWGGREPGHSGQAGTWWGLDPPRTFPVCTAPPLPLFPVLSPQ